jgi:hypothetical protein
MSNRVRSRGSLRGSTLAPILVLAILLTSFSAASMAGASGHESSLGPARSIAMLSPASLASPRGGTGGCNGTNVSFGDSWTVLNSYVNSSANTSRDTVGPAPLNVSVNLTIIGPQTTYNYSVLWGDGGKQKGNLSVGANFSATKTLVHRYVLPAIYYFQGNVSYSCAGVAQNYPSSVPITVYGAAGPVPVVVTANVTSAPVPVDVNYTATIAGAPANATAEWTLVTPIGGRLEFSQSATSLTASTVLQALTIAGTYTGYLGIFYPGGVLEYASVLIPSVQAAPLAAIQLASTPPLGNSPWNLTFWGNVTNLTGGNYTGAGSVEWFFPDFYPTSNSSQVSTYFWSYGPTVGASVWREFELNSTPGFAFQEVLAGFALPNGVIIADSLINLDFSSGAVAVPILYLSVTPSSGPAPLFFNATAQVNTSSNGTANYSLVLDAFLGGTLVWNATTANWPGSAITVPGVLNSSGTYSLVADASVFYYGAWHVVLINSTAMLVVPGATSPPALSFSVSPANGSAPLNLTLSFVAVGGTGPYDLSVCREGPFALPNGTGPCTSIGSASLWNGSSLILLVNISTAGNYTIVANVSDALALNTSAFALVVVAPPVPVAPLSAKASAVAPNSITVDGATYGFVSAVSGGTLPYTIEWSFGDGAMGSSALGAITLHTYTSSGSYFAVLTVTDGRGTQVRSDVGPLAVALPIGPASPVPWWATSSVQLFSAIVGVLSVAILVAMVVRLGRRREALNWFREIEERRDSVESVPRSR